MVAPCPPSEPAEPLADPHVKGDDEIRRMAEAIMDKVVDQLLNEAAEIVLRGTCPLWYDKYQLCTIWLNYVYFCMQAYAAEY